MRINPNETILGISLIKIRHLLRYGNNNDEIAINMATSLLNINETKAKRLFTILSEKSFVILKTIHGQQYWQNTVKGNAMALASAARPINRSTADRIFAEFMKRVKEVNNNSCFLYKVREIRLFGSYLAKVPKINDIDIAVELVPKENNKEIHMNLCLARIQQVKAKGRKFNNITEEVCWPQLEAIRFLKSRSRSLSIHSADGILKNVESKVVFFE